MKFNLRSFHNGFKGRYIHNFSHEEMANHIRGYFTELFGDSNGYGYHQIPGLECPKISEEQRINFMKEADLEEVKRVVFSLNSFSSPGPDGLQAVVYKKFWDTVGSTITNFVNTSLRTGSIPAQILKANMVLIPKNEAPEVAGNFRPIILLNVVYKVISKLLVSRMRKWIGQIIGPFQSSFVPGRGTTDNILITQEVVHSLESRKGRKCGMIMKLDLQKAYDCLSWKFLEVTLTDFGFPMEFTRLIMNSIREMKIGIIWNEYILEDIQPKRGLRQRDLISPYLFILAMERLSHLISREVDADRWKPIRVGKPGISISHLFFADDLMLFGTASREQIEVMMQIMETFSFRSGLEINKDKSRVYLSPNIDGGTRSSLQNLSGIKPTTYLGKYLGAPIIHGRKSKDKCAFILGRVKQRLASWKEKVLNLAGRKTLVQSVTTAIPQYVMQSSLILMSICDSIDKINRNFLWGHKGDRSKIHLVNWDEVCKPKEEGGLGIRKAWYNNLALISKLGWDIMMDAQKLWVKVFKAKYIRNSSFFEITKKSRTSHT
ncbi:unnamed protein product [Cuscuta epithymum]|uniref:Reverse transcriptase domain-containing protein n=1 Tax=Cuscuta epithymum TaxID=186058 RepID=A0AAV0CUE6_9ASTE|nr:unnamed protein product [Cuscuta epithymum]